ncbi:MAG: trimethylamine methyltransferase family protein [Promethearchaeota archaeon]
MKLNQIEVLAKEEINTIHSATLELLERVGIKVDDEKMRNLFEENGAEINNDNKFVKIPEELVSEQLKKVPNSFELYGPDGKYKILFDTKKIYFAPIGAAVKIYDPSSKSGVRKSVVQDTINNLKLVDQLENLCCCQIDIWPGDVKYTTIHVVCIYNWIKNSRKPFGHGCFGRVVSQDSINMASIIAGGHKEIVKRPRLFGILNPTSPLHLPKIMTSGLEVFAKYKQPLVVAPEALAGTSAPATLAGLLTQTNAEILGGIILAQLINPGTPVFYGTVSHITDMRTGNSAIGSIETSLITAGIAQLARFYDIPSRGLGAVTDSKCLDLQNGYERFNTLLFAALSGINFITCASSYEATLAAALELTVIDNELIGMVKRAIDGIEVNEETIALDVIEKVSTSTIRGANFLGEKHTRKYIKKEFFIPTLADRNRRTTWKRKGSLDIISRASERVISLLNNFTEYEIPSDVENKLKNYISEVEKRSFEFYKKEEGITESDVSLPGENA